MHVGYGRGFVEVVRTLRRLSVSNLLVSGRFVPTTGLAWPFHRARTTAFNAESKKRSRWRPYKLKVAKVICGFSHKDSVAGDPPSPRSL